MTRLDIGDDSTFYSHAPDYNRVGQKTSPHIVIRKNTLTICSLDTGKTWHNHDTFDHEHLNLPKYRSDSDILERPNMIFSITNTDSGKVFKPAQLKKS
ncbi:hypothetical protein ISR92_03325 [Patescibacteria group bacterium]|nr:hypothetical protein [Patescibacteria group bacterium]